jgi:hypothetical protein
MRVSLVPGFQPCANPNRTHGAPLAFGSCNPPVQTSGNLTVGTVDANGAAANFVGFMRMTVIAGIPGPPDDSDVSLATSLSDIRCKAILPACVGGALSDYTGELAARLNLRVTDKFNATAPGGGTDPATVEDLTFPVTVPCTPTASTSTGSLCSITTTMNTITPGAIKDTKREVAEVGQVQVDDGGTDGSAATTLDNSQFAVQGVFVP